jgi:pimeloyl-ACP methyl ester carboxylesterase
VSHKPVLIGATKCLSDTNRQTLMSHAQTVRSCGMDHIAAQVVTDDIAVLTKSSKSLVKSYVKRSITSSQPKGYALACLALATAPEPSYSAITAKKTIILAGREDKTSPLATTEFLHEQINGSEVIWLENVGHWHGFEDVEGTAKALTAIL